MPTVMCKLGHGLFEAAAAYYPTEHLATNTDFSTRRVHLMISNEMKPEQQGVPISPIPVGIFMAADQILVPLFRQPFSLPSFVERLLHNKVCLENAFLDYDTLSVRGVVRVLNMDPAKAVYVRWSHDGWKTSFEHCIAKLDGSNDDCHITNYFDFRIYRPMRVGETFAFVLRLECLDQQFWDNNEGFCYTFMCVPNYLDGVEFNEATSWV